MTVISASCLDTGLTVSVPGASTIVLTPGGEVTESDIAEVQGIFEQAGMVVTNVTWDGDFKVSVASPEGIGFFWPILVVLPALWIGYKVLTGWGQWKWPLLLGAIGLVMLYLAYTTRKG